MSVRELTAILAKREFENRGNRGFSSKKEAWSYIKAALDEVADGLKATAKSHTEMWGEASEEHDEADVYANNIAERAIQIADAAIRVGAAAYLCCNAEELAEAKRQETIDKVAEMMQSAEREEGDEE